MHRVRRALIGLACSLTVCLPLSAQDQPRADADTVVLAVTVTDSKNNPISDLKTEDFAVYEDNRAQQITSVSREDVPISMGILVDNSGSMRQKRWPVMNGLLHLVEAGNPQNEVFVVNFNGEPFLDQGFTRDSNLIRSALSHGDPRGGTALYDAVIAAANYIAKHAQYQKRALVVVTDGEDNESKQSLQQAIADVQVRNGPAVYTVGIVLDDPHAGRARKALESLSTQSGGASYFVKNASDLERVAQRIDEDMRSQYSITYQPTNLASNGKLRKIAVTVQRKGLMVRTRTGYVTALDPKSAGR